MNILELPNEVLALCIVVAAYSEPTRQRRRKQLLIYATTCKRFSVICLKQLYSKLAYEISRKGDQLLAALASSASYAESVRALAIRERESGLTRKIVNSRLGAGHTGAAAVSTRQKKAALEAVHLEEGRISTLLSLVKDNIVELKYETNLLPAEDDVFASLAATLQSLYMVPQAPYPEAGDRDSRLEAATFTLQLPSTLFLPAFLAFDQLTSLDLWKCDLKDFNGKLQENKPRFKLHTLVLQECVLDGETLSWIVGASLDAGSLQSLKFAFLAGRERAGSKEEVIHLKRAMLRMIHTSAPTLESFAFDGDEGELDEEEVQSADVQADEGFSPALKPSVLAELRVVKKLELGGMAITERHWSALSPMVFQHLSNLSVIYTPEIPPQAIVDALRLFPSSAPSARTVDLKGTEDLRRRNIRELLASPTEQFADWLWTRTEFVSWASLMNTKEIQWVADRAIVVGNDEDESDEDDLDMQEDEAGDFVVTAEQVRLSCSCT